MTLFRGSEIGKERPPRASAWVKGLWAKLELKKEMLFGSDKTGKEMLLRELLENNVDTFFNQQIKGLRARFEHGMEIRNFRVVAITSSVAGEGKTLLSTCLAANMASEGRKKVLLVDVDLRNSQLAKSLGISPVPGLSEFLGGKAGFDDIVRTSLVKGLHIIPCGTRIAEPADLIGGKALRSFITDIRKNYDMVIVDTPPIIPVSDTLNLLELVDGFLFVIGSNYTPYNIIKDAFEDIGEDRIIGVILNGVDLEKNGYYKKYYGNYYYSTKK